MDFLILGFAILAILILVQAIKIVPQQEAWILETLGKFDRVLQPGLNIVTPFVQRVAYKHSLKEQAVDVMAQSAISNDNVTLVIDGVLYVKVVDAVSASYGVNDPYYAISQLAQTTMRSEIGKLALDRTFEEREALNTAIVISINQAAVNWGIQCMRYEIKDIHPPKSILQSMEMQVAAERRKRAQILDSEGTRQSEINIAEGNKARAVLESEAAYTDKVNRAKGEAEAILCIAESTSKGIDILSKALSNQHGIEAASLKLAEKYIESFGNLAKETNTILLPSNISDPSSFITQAATIFQHISLDKKKSSKE